jgi:hypothetical protein
VGRVIPVLLGLFVLGIGVAIWLYFQDEPAAAPSSAPTPPSTSQPAVRPPGNPAFDAARATLNRLPVRAGIAPPTSPATGSVRRGATT